MTRDRGLIALTAVGSAWCWWPLIREPSLEFSPWIPVGVVALICALSTILANGRWLRSVVASTGGSFLGMWAGLLIWPSDDALRNAYALIPIMVGTAAVLVASLFAAQIGRAVSATEWNRRAALWVALLGCVAFGPVMMAVTPPLVARRMARNDRLAADRLAAMKIAIEATRAGADGSRQRCDLQALSHRYSGPPFSESDWLRVLGGNAVKEDGYISMMNCPGNGTYKINAYPDRIKGDGTRRFCADDSGKTAVGMVSDEQQWRSAMNEAGLPRCP
jgi:hypothetical protein